MIFIVPDCIYEANRHRTQNGKMGRVKGVDHGN